MDNSVKKGISTPMGARFVIKDPNLELELQSEGTELSFHLHDSSGRSAAYTVKEKEVILEQAHRIGREIEQDFNRSNGTIMELSDVSRVIGMVHRRHREIEESGGKGLTKRRLANTFFGTGA